MTDLPKIQPSRACKCLNVRIWPQLHPENTPDFLIAAVGDSEYTLTYVGDKGISIAHPQVTMRTRKIRPYMADSSRCIRFTTLTCLLCQTVVYRVQQPVGSDMDIQDGPLLPSPDWVEQETLLSSCGWIEVHKDCLPAEDVVRLSSSSTYSSTFGIALPQNATTTATPTQPTHESHQESRVQTIPSGPFLCNLRPLFPPAPFVPSHPVFAHLSSIAVEASERLRSLAEEQITAIVQDKFAELERADDRLRHDVEVLWRKFVENLGEVEKQLGPKVGETRRRDSSRGVSLSSSGVSGTPVVSVRHFVPTPSTVPRLTSPSSSRSRVSSLSASLATHHFHMGQGPIEAHERPLSDSPRSPPPYSSHPSSLGSAESPISSSLESSLALSPRLNSDGVMQPFKRSMDETRDTAVSFRYFRILEADVTRAREQQAASHPNIRSDCAPKTGEPAEETGDLNAANVTTPAKQPEGSHVHPPDRPDRDVIHPTDETPRRRKVKFDITAEPVSGERASPRINGESQENEELIFDFEDASSDPESSDAALTLPFVENARSRRRGRHRVARHGALPESLSSLRPASLPAYSSLRSKVTGVPATSVSNSGRLPSTPPTLLSQEAQPEYPEELDPQEEEILKLVAANTPSHRNAWKRNSKAWQLFVSRRRNGVPGALIPEETEDGKRAAGDTSDGDWGTSKDVRWSLGNAGFPTSLPIDISPLSRRKEPLSLASYQPKTSLSDRAGTIVPAFPDGRRHTPSATLRRASYAERDRSRSIDPGALDFIAGDAEEAEDDESDEEPSKANLADEGRGRQRAFKILQARSKIPEAGMWMSLA